MVSDTSKIISGACFSGACFLYQSAVLEMALGTLLQFSQKTYEVRYKGNDSGSFLQKMYEMKHGENGFDQVGRMRKPVTGMRNWAIILSSAQVSGCLFLSKLACSQELAKLVRY